MKPFFLTYEFSDPAALDKANELINTFIDTYPDNHDDLTIKEMLTAIDSDFYNNLTRGDKCRVGRAISRIFSDGKFFFLERGERKGATNTYHII